MIRPSILLVSLGLFVGSKAIDNDTDTFYGAICLNGRNSSARFGEIGDKNVTYCEAPDYINNLPFYVADGGDSGDIKIYYKTDINIDGITGGMGFVIYLEGEIKGYCLDETDPLDCSQQFKITDGDNFILDSDMTVEECSPLVIWEECDFGSPSSTDLSSTEDFDFPSSTEEIELEYMSICNDGRDPSAKYKEIGDDDVTYCPFGVFNGYWAYYTMSLSGMTYMYYDDEIDIQGITGEGYVIMIMEESGIENIVAICLDEMDPTACSQKWKVLDYNGDFTMDSMMTTRDCGYDGYMEECDEFPYSSTEISSTEDDDYMEYDAVCFDGRSGPKYDEIGDDNVAYCKYDEYNGYPKYLAGTPSGDAKLYYMEGISDPYNYAEVGDGWIIYYEGQMRAYCIDEMDPTDCSGKWMVDDGDAYTKDTVMTTEECSDELIVAECEENDDDDDDMSTTDTPDNLDDDDDKPETTENPDNQSGVNRFETMMAILTMIFCYLWNN